MLITMVGGPVKAAGLTGRSRGHIDNMRKPGAVLRLDDLLALAEEAGVSLDWVATGYQVRPDLAGKGETVPVVPAGVAGSAGANLTSDFARLLPLKPELVRQGPALVERWAASEIAVSQHWLSARGLSTESARYAIVADGGMDQLIAKGAMVVIDVRPASPRSGVYLVGLGDELVARRLNKMPDGRSELVADAEPSWRFSLPPEGENGLILHRIVWAGQDF